MKATIIGGSGLIGSGVAAVLEAAGHEVLRASPRTGVDAVTGQGLAQALAGADVVIDVANSPSFAPDDVMAFFTRSTANLVAAARAAGVGHYLALSVVGTERAGVNAYFAAKRAQERLIEAGGVPWTLVRATQFFEFGAAIGETCARAGALHVSPALVQPMAAADVADAVAFAARGAPRGVHEIAGPQSFGLDAFVRRVAAAAGDARHVIADPSATYFGAPIDDASLRPLGAAWIAPTRLDDWLAARAAAPAA